MQQAVAKILPQIQPHLQQMEQLDPELIRDNQRFTETVANPLLLTIAAASGGITSMIPDFKNRFTTAMLTLRDELVVFDHNRVTLVEDYQHRLPDLMTEALKP
jgi:hypothetical protein